MQFGAVPVLVCSTSLAACRRSASSMSFCSARQENCALARSFRAASFPEQTGRGSGRIASPNGARCPKDTADSSNGRRLPERIGAHGSGSIPGTSFPDSTVIGERVG
jgi:hypothetical protein